MIKNNIIFIVFFVIISGCTSKCYNNKIKSIEVFYIKGEIAPPVMLQCGQIRSRTDDFIVDTLLSEKKIFITVENLIADLERKGNNNDFSNCDIRVECIVNYYSGQPKFICIGKFNCVTLNKKYLEECDSLSYLIKRNAGYYNYFDRDQLVYFKEIQKYGIPDDYKLIRRQKFPIPNK